MNQAQPFIRFQIFVETIPVLKVIDIHGCIQLPVPAGGLLLLPSGIKAGDNHDGGNGTSSQQTAMPHRRAAGSMAILQVSADPDGGHEQNDKPDVAALFGGYPGLHEPGLGLTFEREELRLKLRAGL